MEKHFCQVEEIRTTLAKASVNLLMNKCTFFSDMVEYLEHVIGQSKLELYNTQTASLTQPKPPKTKSEHRSFLGL